MASKIRLGAQLITATQAAEVLQVSPRTIHNWIDADKIPYLTLPSNGGKPSYRIPLHGLLNALSGDPDVIREVERYLTAGDADQDH